MSTGVGTSDLASEVCVSAGEAACVVCGQADVHSVVDIAPLWVVIRLFSEDCNGGHECKGADKIWKRQRDVQPSVLNFPLAWTDTRIVGKKVLYFLLSQAQYQLDSPVDAVDSGKSRDSSSSTNVPAGMNERAIPSHRARYGGFCQQVPCWPSAPHWTAAAKIGCGFAVRTLFSLSIAGFVWLARSFERCSGGFQWNPLGKVLLTSRGCPCSAQVRPRMVELAPGDRVKEIFG